MYSANPHRRFEYKLSFKGPHLVQRDGSIPFWEHGGRKYEKVNHMVRILPCVNCDQCYSVTVTVLVLVLLVQC